MNPYIFSLLENGLSTAVKKQILKMCVWGGGETKLYILHKKPTLNIEIQIKIKKDPLIF